MIMYYYDGNLKRRVYQQRGIKKEDMNPMAIDVMIEQGFFDKCVQVLVDTVGGQAWINIKKTQLIT